jgi:hypothetical protein
MILIRLYEKFKVIHQLLLGKIVLKIEGNSRTRIFSNKVVVRGLDFLVTLYSVGYGCYHKGPHCSSMLYDQTAQIFQLIWI